VPDTLQAVIGARLDAIPGHLRAVVQDAAVVGAAFWPGALAAPCGRTQAEVDAAVDDLAARGVVVEEPASRLAGHRELTFGHALYREVAYGRLPRLARARRHLAAGRWLEEAAGDRATEHAGAIAHHFDRAVELAEEADADDVRTEAVEPATRWLLVAADEAIRTDETGARGLYERALALSTDGSHARAAALVGSGLMGRRSGTLPGREVLERYATALAIERGLGDPRAIGSTLVRLASQLGALGETGRAREALAEAVEVLGGLPPGRELARALAFRAEEEMFAGRTAPSLEMAGRALALAHEVGADDAAIIALHIRGDARCSSGDPGGLDDLREATALAEASGSVFDVVTSMTYVAEWTAAFEGPSAALERFQDAVALADRRGAASQGQWTKATMAWALLDAGRWHQALETADAILATGADHLDLTVFATCGAVRVAVLLLTGRVHEAGRPEDLVETARPTEELQALAPTLVVAAAVARETGRDDLALAYVDEFETATRGFASEYRTANLPDAVRIAVASGDVDLAARLVETAEARTVRDHLAVDTARAVVAAARADHEAAVAGLEDVIPRWHRFGQPRQEAEALLGLSRSLEGSDPARATAAAEEGRAILDGLARPPS
jgi:tetratricopeptide (TPR) repeat protein